MRQLVHILLLTLIAGCAMAQTQPDAASKELGPGSSVDDILDALDSRGRGLDAFLADVSLSETDTGVGDTSTRGGKVAYQVKPGGDARIRVYFTTIQRSGKSLREQFIYLLNNGTLIERNYPGKSQVTRQVLKPGEKINLLKLGEGPFPLPIGQPRQEVLKQFDVKKIAPLKDDPSGTVHVQLTPKSGTRFARQFKSIDVWVDASTHMPRRIETMDSTQTTIRTTDLQNVQVNPTLTDADFELEKIDLSGWNLVDEKYED
jgi:outer membrane lipoprotein-sorting protein